MLTNLTPDGQMTWNCHECGSEQTAHVSHKDVQYVSHHNLVTPQCQECLDSGISARILLKTSWSEEELTPPVLSYYEDGSIAHVEKKGALNFTDVKDHYEMRRDANGDLVRTRIIDSVIHPTPAVILHMRLEKHMASEGKTYAPPPPPDPQPLMLEPEQLQQVIEHLKSQGLIA